MGRARTQIHTLAVTAANQQLLGANEHRWSLTFSPALVESYSVNFGEAAVTGGGLVIRPGIQPVTFTRDQLGDIIGAPVSFIGTGAVTVGVLEVNDACCRRQDN